MACFRLSLWSVGSVSLLDPSLASYGRAMLCYAGQQGPFLVQYSTYVLFCHPCMHDRLLQGKAARWVGREDAITAWSSSHPTGDGRNVLDVVHSMYLRVCTTVALGTSFFRKMTQCDASCFVICLTLYSYL